MDWSDLRAALAVGQHKRLSDAARALGVNATTISRRITSLEADLQTPLFTRTPRRWTPTPAGDAVLARCAAMATQARALVHDVDAASERVAGKVRLTAIDAVMTTWIVPALPDLRARHPELLLELFAANEMVDLTRGHADVALRLGRPTEAGLVVRKIADVPLVLAGHATLRRRVVDERPLVLIGFLDTRVRENRHLQALGGRPVLSSTSYAVCAALVQSGQAVGVLPAAMAEAAGLEVITADLPGRELWRAVPEALADTPRLRAVTAWLDAWFAPGGQGAAPDAAA
jgi:DNA-binding transcriptional LysR family regulator